MQFCDQSVHYRQSYETASLKTRDLWVSMEIRRASIVADFDGSGILLVCFIRTFSAAGPA